MLNLSPAALDWVKIQRTQVCKFDDPAAAYEAELLAEAAQIRPFIPSKVDHIVGIGSGMGGLELLIWLGRAPPKPTLTIIDKTGDGKVQAGFVDKMATFTNTEIASEFMQMNGMDGEKLMFVEPLIIEKGAFNVVEPADLVVSFLSWCHHYPVAAYGEFVKDRVRQGGVVIVDIRNGTDGVKQFADLGFREVASLTLGDINARKTKRVVFEKM